MKPPAQVRIGSKVLPLKADSAACKAGGVTGQALIDDFYVIYDDHRPGEVLKDSILHELVHVIWSETSLCLRFPDAGNESDGEHIIRDLTPRLLALLRDNPRLVQYLTEK